jgi:hypothetical protein
MKRFSLSVVLSLTITLLAFAPQLRADSCDHVTTDSIHGNTIASFSSANDGDARHWEAWASNGAFTSITHETSSPSSSSSQTVTLSTTGNGDSAQTASTSISSSSPTVSIPETSSLLLLFSGLLAAAIGLPLKKTAA